MTHINNDFKKITIPNLKNFEFRYKIESIEEEAIYVYKTKYTKNRDTFFLDMKELYKKLKKEHIFEVLIKNGLYGLTIKNNNNEQLYCAGCAKELIGTEKIIIEKGNYLVFDCGGDTVEYVEPVITNAYSYFAKYTNFSLEEKICIEKYIGNNCYVYIKIKKD